MEMISTHGAIYGSLTHFNRLNYVARGASKNDAFNFSKEQ